MKLIHVVRRYGAVGGMERYVWELTHELAAAGHQVLVLCQRCYTPPITGIQVVELGELALRPRWLGLLRFGWQVSRWLAENPHPDWLIHSHERLDEHHVTTFHGPPFATVRDMAWHRKISLRVWMQMYLERRELSVARVIVPNSPLIKNQLAHYYPSLAHKLSAPIVPGVAAVMPRPPRRVAAEGGVIGFVGKEWARKGLPLAVNIVRALRQSRPQLELWVIGVEAAEVQHLFADWQGGYRLLGWQSDNDYLAELDVLLHPARAEPYGMVIAEAMAARVSVVLSEVCGAAADVSTTSGCVLPLNAPLGAWTAAVERQLQRTDAPPAWQHGWDKVAAEYVKIYRELV